MTSGCIVTDLRTGNGRLVINEGIVWIKEFEQRIKNYIIDLFIKVELLVRPGSYVALLLGMSVRKCFKR